METEVVLEVVAYSTALIVFMLVFVPAWSVGLGRFVKTGLALVLAPLALAVGVPSDLTPDFMVEPFVWTIFVGAAMVFFGSLYRIRAEREKLFPRFFKNSERDAENGASEPSS